MSRSFAAWVAVLSLAAFASGCTGGGGGGGGGSNEAPDAIDDTATTGEDTPVTIDATANDTDADDDVLLVGSFTDAANGTVAIQGDGTFLYTPDPDFNGTDTFTYVVTDGPDVDDVPATVTVTVNAAGDVPVAADDDYSATEDTLLTIDAAAGVLGNDSDSDSSITAVLDQTTADGTLALAADGSFTYDPDPDFDGVDTFTYHATDGVDDSSIVTVTIAVGGVNDAPVATANSFTATEDTALVVDAASGVILGGVTADSDVDGDALNALVQTAPTSGSLALNADGSFTYTPNANFNGSDSFTYVARDGVASSAAATVSLTVTAVNDAPVANSDSYALSEDSTLNQAAAGGLLTNDTDVEGTALDAQLVGAGPANAASFTLNADGSFVYTPNANFNGFDSFTYRAFDGDLNSGAPTTVFLSIGAVNDAPTADADSYSTDEDTALVVNAASGVLNGDADVDGQPLNALVQSGPSNGSLALNADGSFTYTPSANFSGSDSFTYVARDGVVSSAPATVSLTIDAVNDAPIAVADSYGGTEDTALSVAAPGVLSNDSDPDSSMTASLVSGPSNAASFTLAADGSFSYTPNANFNGADSFTYAANDGANGNTVTVSLSIGAVNDPPTFTVATNEILLSEDSGAVSFANFAQSISAGPADEGGQTVSFTVVSPGLSLFSALPTVNPAGQLDFTLAADAFGGTALTITAQDSAGASSAPQVVQLTVTGINDPPSFDILSSSVTVDEDAGPTTIAGFAFNFSAGPDESEPVFLEFVSASNFTGNLYFADQPNLTPAGDLTFTTGVDAFGTADVTIRIVDAFYYGGEASAFADRTFTITVDPVNDTPAFEDSGDVNASASSGPITIFGWAYNITGIDFGETAAFDVTFEQLGDDALFEVAGAPAIDANGDLTFDPAFQGEAEMKVVLGDGALFSSDHFFTIFIQDPTLPPSLISSTPADLDILSMEEAYGSGAQLQSADFVFDDSDLDCDGVIATVTGSLSGVIGGVTKSCAVPGHVRLFVPFISTVQDGETLTFDFEDVCDTINNCAAPGLGNGTAFSVSVGLDTQAPSIEEDLDPFTCQVNWRVFHRFNEAMDPSSASTFTFELFDDFTATLTPVDAEPAGGTGFGTLRTTNDTFWFVPRDLLVGGQLHYEVFAGGLSDVAGNPYGGGTQFINVCGGGSSMSQPQVVSAVEFDPDQTVPIHATVSGTEISNGAFLAPGVIGGSLDEVEFVIDTATYLNGENIVSANGSLFMECRQDPCPNQSAPVTSFGGDRVRFEPLTTTPFFEWESGVRYSASFYVQGSTMSRNIDLEFYIQTTGDSFSPRVTAVSARRSAADGSSPLIRPEEPLTIGLSEAVDPRTLVASNFQVVGSSGVVDIDLRRNEENRLGAPMILLRARGPAGEPAPFAPDTYTLTISNLEDIADPQNAQAVPQVFTFEVGTLAVTPSLLDATPNDGSVFVGMDSAGDDRIFVAFDDAMSTSSFVDTGDPLAVTRGFALSELITETAGLGGTVAVPKKGLVPESTSCCGGNSGDRPFSNEGVVALSFGGQGNQVSGFRNGTSTLDVGYELEVFDTVTNVDGTPVDSGAVLAFSTHDDDGSTDLTPRLEYFSPRGIQIFGGGFTFGGQPLQTAFEWEVEFSAADTTGPGDTNTLYFYGSLGTVVGSTNAQPNYVNGSVDAAGLATLFAPGSSNILDVSIEDLAGNFFNLPQRLYYPSTSAPTPSLTFGTNGDVTASGTISGLENDAARVGSVEVAILTIDASGTNAIDLNHGQLASLYRDPGTGDVTYTAVFRDIVLPDSPPNTYHALAAISYPFESALGPQAVTVFSGISAAIPPNGPPPMVTISGTVFEASLSGNGPPVSGALVELVGTGIQTTTDVNGNWSLQVLDGQLVYIRYTHASYVGTQRLLTTDAGLNFGDIVLPPALFAQVYEMTSPGATHTPGTGSLFVEDFDENDPSPFSVDLGALLYDTSGQPFGDDGTAFLNVDPGDDTITVTSPPGCGFETRGAIVASPAPLKITPDILTFMNLVCPEPFFTEYIDPSAGNNKAVEIYNPSTVARDLTGCAVTNFRNGGTSTTSIINLTATVAAGDVHVVCHSSNTLPVGTCDQVTGSLDFNGNDVIELSCGGTVLDVIGQLGAGDPGAGGWGTPPNSTVDTTLRRRCSVTSGDGNASDPFDPSNDWEGVGTDVFADLGSPSCIP